jgi:hypothetical protein
MSAGKPKPGTTVKKPYKSPVLTSYGTVAKLTQATGSRNGDGGHTRMS